MFAEVVKAWNTIIGGIQNVHASGNAIHTIDEEDAAIHQGEAFHFGKKIYLSPGGIAMLAGTVGSSRRIHFSNLSIAATTGPIEIGFYRDSAVQSGTGTIEVSHNRRLDITSGSQMVIKSGVTLTTTGEQVVLSANLATPSIAQNTSPSEAGFFHGFVMDYNKTYSIGLKNLDTSTSTLWANFTYTEPRYL